MPSNRDLVTDLVAIQQSIARGSLVLPGIADGSQELRQALAEDEPDPRTITAAIRRDPGLSSYMIKVANSAARRGEQETDSPLAALHRLGLKLTGVMVTNFALMQMVGEMKGPYRKRVAQVYQHSRETAAYCHALARAFTNLPPDKALLAGLVHDVGKLVVLQFAARKPELNAEPGRLEQLLRYTHASLGASLLRNWRFPEAVIAAVAAHESWMREVAGGEPDLADLIIASQIDLHRGTTHPMADLSDRQVPAMDRLGLPEGVPFRDWPEFRRPFRESCALLGLR